MGDAEPAFRDLLDVREIRQEREAWRERLRVAYSRRSTLPRSRCSPAEEGAVEAWPRRIVVRSRYQWRGARPRGGHSLRGRGARCQAAGAAPRHAVRVAHLREGRGDDRAEAPAGRRWTGRCRHGSRPAEDTTMKGTLEQRLPGEPGRDEDDDSFGFVRTLVPKISANCEERSPNMVTSRCHGNPARTWGKRGGGRCAAGSERARRGSHAPSMERLPSSGDGSRPSSGSIASGAGWRLMAEPRQLSLPARG